jgi:hypothetical protein
MSPRKTTKKSWGQTGRQRTLLCKVTNNLRLGGYTKQHHKIKVICGTLSSRNNWGKDKKEATGRAFGFLGQDTT